MFTPFHERFALSNCVLFEDNKEQRNKLVKRFPRNLILFSADVNKSKSNKGMNCVGNMKAR